MQQPRQFIFAGGGTGGHLFPAIAVAEALKTIAPACASLFLCTEKKIDDTILSARKLSCQSQPVIPIPKNPIRWLDFFSRWKKSKKIVAGAVRDRAACVIIGTGGYGSGPALAWGLKAGVRTALLNPDAVPGRANRHFAAKVNAVYYQWRVTSRNNGKPDNSYITGCPVRREFVSATAENGRQLFGLDPGRKTLLVTGASQGAQTINQAIERLLPLLAAQDAWQTVLLAGESNAARLGAAFAAAGVRGRVIGFSHDMAALLAAADLVVSRAGASTLAEIAVTGTPSILLPYPFHKDRHQWHNARQLSDVGAAVIVDDRIEPAVNADALRAALEPLLSDDDARERMRCAAFSAARPDAADAVAQHLLAL